MEWLVPGLILYFLLAMAVGYWLKGRQGKPLDDDEEV